MSEPTHPLDNLWPLLHLPLISIHFLAPLPCLQPCDQPEGLTASFRAEPSVGQLLFKARVDGHNRLSRLSPTFISFLSNFSSLISPLIFPDALPHLLLLTHLFHSLLLSLWTISGLLRYASSSAHLEVSEN